MHWCDTDLREIAMENQALSQDNIVRVQRCVSNLLQIYSWTPIGETHIIFWSPSSYNEDYHD